VNKDLDSTVRAESVLEAQPHIDKAILVEQLKALGYID
jgi:hypothetical protein